MNIFENRVKSFNNKTSKWPLVQKNSHKPETFARAGLYFARRPKLADSLRCFLCEVELSQWKQGQSPFMRHAHESPQCPWVVLDFPDNPSHDLDVDYTTAKGTRFRNARLATFNKHDYWPPKIKSQKWPLASKLVNAGFYFAPSQVHPTKVKCPCCHAEINEPIESIDFLKAHKEISPDCIFLRKSIKPNNSRVSLSTTKSHNSNEDSKNDPKDSFWDIDQSFTQEEKSIATKPMITYSKRTFRNRSLANPKDSSKESKKDRKRQKLLTENVLPLDVTSEIQSSVSNADVLSKEKEYNQERIEIPAKKDKGKGRAVEHMDVPIRTMAKKGLSLSKKKNPVASIEPYVLIGDPSTSWSQSTSPHHSTSSNEPSHYLPQQSTPTENAEKVDIFSECPYSPIQSKDDILQTKPSEPSEAMNVERFVLDLVERNKSALQREAQEAIEKIRREGEERRKEILSKHTSF